MVENTRDVAALNKISATLMNVTIPALNAMGVRMTEQVETANTAAGQAVDARKAAEKARDEAQAATPIEATPKAREIIAKETTAEMREILDVLSSSEVVTPEDLASALADAIAAAKTDPVGKVIIWTTTNAPAGYLKCDGSEVSRFTYAELFNAIGTTFGGGNGYSTFNIPDLRGVVVRGHDAGRGVDNGRGFSSFQGDDFASHFHTNGSLQVTASSRAGGGESMLVVSGQFTGGSGGMQFTFPVNRGNTGSNGGNETRMKNVALTFCIKYQ